MCCIARNLPDERQVLIISLRLQKENGVLGRETILKSRKLCITLIMLVLIFTAAACSQDKNAEQDDTIPSGYPMTIVDFLGREVVLEKPPQRIVSLSPATTEILFALGVGDRIVGVTEYDDFPPEVETAPKVGGFKGPNIEAIVEQKPDIVFASTLSGQASMDALQNLGIPVIMLEAEELEQIPQSISLISTVTGTQPESEELIKEIEAKMAWIEDLVSEQPRIKVFYLVYSNGNWTTGRGTFIDELLSIAGGENIVDEAEGWIQYSVEKMVEKNPDVIITSPHAGNVKNLFNMPGYKDTAAVKNGRVFVVSDDNIISRASYRIVQGLEEIARFLHPEVF